MYVPNLEVPSRLHHEQSGANVDNQAVRIPMTLKFADGKWTLNRVQTDGDHFGRRSSDGLHELCELTQLQAQMLTDLHGECISAAVVVRNWRKWAEAALAWTDEELRKTRQKAEAQLLVARQKVERARTLTRQARREGSAPS